MLCQYNLIDHIFSNNRFVVLTFKKLATNSLLKLKILPWFLGCYSMLVIGGYGRPYKAARWDEEMESKIQSMNF